MLPTFLGKVRALFIVLAPEQHTDSRIALIVQATEADWEKTVPLGRLSQPDDVASAIGWLASDEAKFITGVCLEVDGGRCI